MVEEDDEDEEEGVVMDGRGVYMGLHWRLGRFAIVIYKNSRLAMILNCKDTFERRKDQ